MKALVVFIFFAENTLVVVDEEVVVKMCYAKEMARCVLNVRYRKK